MNTGGWIFLTTSLAFVWILTIWCFVKVLSVRDEPPDPVRDFHSA